MAVAIIAALGAIAYPSYRNHVVRTNRAAAQSYMMNLAAREDQIMLDRRSYAAPIGTTASVMLLSAPFFLGVPDDVSRYYFITVTLLGSLPIYIINATPLPNGMQASDGTMTLDTAGK